MVAFCREVSKDTGEIAVYPLKCEVTDSLLFQLGLRARVNPELRYFVTTKAQFDTNWKLISTIMHRKNITPETVNSIGGVMEL